MKNLINTLSWSKILSLLIFTGGFILIYNGKSTGNIFELSIIFSSGLIGNKTWIEYLKNKKGVTDDINDIKNSK